MARAITALSPDKAKRLKVAVLSMSRSGTYGLHIALGILGYKSYHMVELFKNGFPDINYLNEAVDSTFSSKGHHFKRKDFEEWMGNYDAITEPLCFMPEDFLAAYAEDPNLKIILTERDPHAWWRSIEATIGAFWIAIHSFPLVLARHCDAHLSAVCNFVDKVIDEWTDGKGLTDEGRVAAHQYYVDYILKVKRLVPPQRRLVVRLEDGLGWEQICPYLGVPIPDVPWPIKHNPVEFTGVLEVTLRSTIQRAMPRLVGIGAVMIAGAATGIWYYLRE